MSKTVLGQLGSAVPLNITDVNLLSPKKAKRTIVVTDDGIVTLVNEVQSANAP